MNPPIAQRRGVARTLHKETVTDDYGWLRDRQDPEVLAHLEAENAYTAAATSHLEELRSRLFYEIKDRVQETDLSAPVRWGKWWYGRRTEEGQQYPRFVRWAETPAGEGQVYLDQNELAAGHSFCDIGVLLVSNDQNLLAYSVDHSGNENFTLRFRHLDTGKELPEALISTYYGGAWSTDGRYFFYTTIDHAHRPHQLWRHRLETSQAEDVLVYQETDERFYLDHVGSTRDHTHILIPAESSTTSEVWVIPTDQPESDPQVLLPRVQGIRYIAEHKAGSWLIVTDEDAPNGRLFSYPVGDPPTEGTELIGHDPETKIGRVLPFQRHLVIVGRKAGLPVVTIWPDGATAFDVEFDEPSYQLAVGENLEFDAAVIRLAYESFLTAARIIDVDLDSGALTVVKETEVAGGFDPTEYEQSRLWATAADGVKVPISLVRRKGIELPAPTLLYGYGAYESVVDPWFSPARISLLDRGVVYAVAHVRGGGEMGRLWHERGRMAHKHNTFTDFIASAEHLVAAGIAQPGNIAARGVSAGGLLMGAIATMRPDLWAAVVAEVPFVDVINTMLDPTIPLTVGEWEEWGNPVIVQHYQWMVAYSPYENTRPAEYPAILATGGFNDPRVAYWEPAKWVARLRRANRGSRPVLLKTELGSGHSGPSGRYDNWREQAFVLAFVLDQLGVGT
jgi:oligopeptidase B